MNKTTLPTTFWTAGSPLEGKPIPRDWFRMNLNGKREALVRVGIANDYQHASSLLGQHAWAVRRARAIRKAVREQAEKERGGR